MGDFTYSLYDILKNNDIIGSICKRKHTNVYSINFDKTATIKLGDFMYKNTGKQSLKMIRKHDKFLKSVNM